MELFVVRHGQTEWNVMKKMQGSADIELNEQGLSQAEETSDRLKEYDFDIIYCSPLKRAKQTASIIGEGRNCNIVYDERLRERNYGEFEGTSKSSFDYNEFWAYTKNLNYYKAENVQEFFKRIYDFLDEITKKEYEKVLIVCHAGVEKAIECYFNGLMKDEEIGPYLPDNASVLKYELKRS